MSTTYTCDRCGYQTQLRGNYNKHLNRKNPCVRSPTSSSIQVQIKAHTPQSPPPPQIEEIDDRPTNQALPITTVRNIGDETLTHVTDHVVGLLFLELDIPALVEYLHFDSDYPENRNVEYIDDRHGYIFRNGNWSRTTMEDICRELMMQCHGIFTKYYRTYYMSIIENDMSDKEFNQYVDILDAIQREDPIVCQEVACNIRKCLHRLCRIATDPPAQPEPIDHVVDEKSDIIGGGCVSNEYRRTYDASSTTPLTIEIEPTKKKKVVKKL